MTASPAARAALLSAFGCYVMWGFMPLLFMAHGARRVRRRSRSWPTAPLWAVLFAGPWCWLAGQGGQVRARPDHAEDARLAGPLDRC